MMIGKSSVYTAPAKPVVSEPFTTRDSDTVKFLAAELSIDTTQQQQHPEL